MSGREVEAKLMASHGRPSSPDTAPPTTIAARAFSKTIAMTYVGLGLFGLLLLITSFYDLLQAAVSRSPSRLIPCAALLGFGAGFIYVMLALRQRCNWARYAAVTFWLLCLIWTTRTIVRNGLHPEPSAGPLQYSNAAQLAGARSAALVIPYFLAVLESTTMYCLLRKASVVKQFLGRGV